MKLSLFHILFIFVGIKEVLDLYVVMDNSNSLDTDSFNVLKLYAKGIIDEYDIGRGKETLGSLITYNSEPTVEVDIDSGISRQSFKEIVNSITVNNYNKPRLDKALEKVNALLNDRAKSKRKDIPSNVLLLTNG